MSAITATQNVPHSKESQEELNVQLIWNNTSSM